MRRTIVPGLIAGSAGVLALAGCAATPDGADQPPATPSPAMQVLDEEVARLQAAHQNGEAAYSYRITVTRDGQATIRDAFDVLTLSTPGDRTLRSAYVAIAEAPRQTPLAVNLGDLFLAVSEEGWSEDGHHGGGFRTVGDIAQIAVAVPPAFVGALELTILDVSGTPIGTRLDAQTIADLKRTGRVIARVSDTDGPIRD